jgi:hypothetical protein
MIDEQEWRAEQADAVHGRVARGFGTGPMSGQTREKNRERAYAAVIAGAVEHVHSEVGGPGTVVTADGRTLPTQRFLAEVEAEILRLTRQSMSAQDRNVTLRAK